MFSLLYLCVKNIWYVPIFRAWNAVYQKYFWLHQVTFCRMRASMIIWLFLFFSDDFFHLQSRPQSTSSTVQTVKAHWGVVIVIWGYIDTSTWLLSPTVLSVQTQTFDRMTDVEMTDDGAFKWSTPQLHTESGAAVKSP